MWPFPFQYCHFRQRLSLACTQTGSLLRLAARTDLDALAAQCIQHAESLLAPVRRPQSSEDVASVVDRLDAVSNNLCSLIDYASTAARLHASVRRGVQADAVAERTLRYMSELNGDPRLYHSLRACLDTTGRLSEEARRVGTALATDFEQSGITLDAQTRGELSKLQLHIDRQGRFFEDDPNGAFKHLEQLVHLRHRMSQILGFESFAHMTLRDKILSTPAMVIDFLRQHHRDDLERQRPASADAARRNQRLGLKESLDLLGEVCKEYFCVSFTTTRCALFGRECWQLSFADLDGGRFMGEVILCPVDAAGAACHFPIRTWRKRPSENVVYQSEGPQTPICVITLHLRDGASFGQGELQSLFHEFGHALHTILGETEYHHLSGTRCKLDFAEVPSTLMELILADRLAIGDVVSPRQAEHQMQLSLFDLFVHGAQIERHGDFEGQVLEWCASQTRTESAAKALKDSVRHFRHLVSYGASYFSYTWCRRVAQDIHRKYFCGPDARATGHGPLLFRRRALMHGGTRSTREILNSLQIP